MIAVTGQRKGYLSDRQYFSQISDVTLSAPKCTQLHVAKNHTSFCPCRYDSWVKRSRAKFR